MSMTKEIVKCWIFKSSSGTKRYQTLLYSDGSLSCDCPGWTKRSVRTCKHTRLVEIGTHIADEEAESYSEFKRSVLDPSRYPASLNDGDPDQPTLRSFDL